MLSSFFSTAGVPSFNSFAHIPDTRSMFLLLELKRKTCFATSLIIIMTL